MMRARLRVYDTDYSTERGLLPFVAGTLRFSMNVDGDGDLTFDALKADVDALQAWVCGIKLELETSHGTWQAVALYSPRNEFRTRAGTGIVTLIAQETFGVWARETLVMPEEMAATTWPHMPDDREMGWMASAYDPAQDKFGEPWALCVEVSSSHEYVDKRPKNWPTGTGAKWITAAGDWEAFQRKYFRAWLTVPDVNGDGTRVRVRFYLAAEESSTLYVAGALVYDEEFSEGEWKNKYRARSIWLSPGTYAVGIVNDSVADRKPVDGFKGVDPTLFAAGVQTPDGTISQWLLASAAGAFRACRRTDDPDTVAGRPPGPTPGEALTYIITEAKQRAVTGWPATTFGFTGAVDSYSQPWAEVVTERQWRVGDDYFDVIQALSETDDLDCWLDPATLVLHAAPKRGTSKGMVWTEAQIASLNVSGSGYRGTWVMGQTAHSHWRSRWITGQPRREYLLTMGQATSMWTAHRILDASLRDGWRWDGVAKLRTPATGWVPFVDYNLGDWGSIDYADAQQQVCVQEIAATAGEGGLLWELSLAEYPPPVLGTMHGGEH